MTGDVPRLDAGTERHLENYLYNYAKVRADIAARQADLTACGTDRPGETIQRRGRGVSWSDPTFTRVALLMGDANLQEWTRIMGAIDAVREHPALPAEMTAAFDRWYGIGGCKQGWRTIADELGLSRSTVYRYRQTMLALIAGRLGWLMAA